MSASYVVLIILATIFACYEVLLHFGVFEIALESKKASDDVLREKKFATKRKVEQSKLSFYTLITNMFRGILMSDLCYEKHVYYINRLELRSEILNRLYTPEEIRGKYAAPLFFSLLLIPLVFWFPFVLVIPIGLFIYFLFYQQTYQAKIRDEDEIIDDYFINLYLLIYSKLRQGSRARIQGTVENYIETLELSTEIEVKNVMLKLSRTLLNLLSLYEDHVAVPKLKDIYHSATIINFCNVAAQSLNGVDNYDNLLTFKMMLVERKTHLMRLRSEKLVIKGNRAIYAIYIILFIFIAVGWYSKLPTGMGSMF